MTLEQYRILHSTLMEQYQWIEFDLEGLYAFICEKPFAQAIEEIEKDAIGGIVRAIQRIEQQRAINVFSQEEYERLDRIRERRNFWSHACYTEARDKKTGAPKNADRLTDELKDAKDFSERLRQIKEYWGDRYREQN
jgi:hypothetical protein